MRPVRLGLGALPALVAATAGTAAPAAAQPRPLASGTELGEVRLFAAESARALLFLFSGGQGWGEEQERVAQRLARGGISVVGVDLPAYLATLEGDDARHCLYVVGDIEDTSKLVQRELGVKTYLSPIVAGAGEAGIFVYAALAQAPAVTLEGAVSLDPAATLPTHLPFCGGAPAEPGPQGFTFGRASSLPGWWRVGVREGVANPYPFADDMPEGETLTLPAGLDPAEAFDRLVTPVAAELAQSHEGKLADLPITEVPAEGDGRLLAVFLSGDGGWRDIDKQIAGWLAEHGVAVVGLDSLRYFWTARTPEEVARDIARIAAHYMARWQRRQLVLIGYSFGANVLPAATARLPATLQAKLVLVSLLAVADKADFEFHITGWLGRSSGEEAPVAPELARLDPRILQCVYGAEEEDSLCPSPLFDKGERIRTEGGHHFDGDYAAIARRILEAAERRSTIGAMSGATR